MAGVQPDWQIDSRTRLLQDVIAATLFLKAARIQDLLRKAGFRPDQPRVPAGNSGGGQWTDEFDDDLVFVSDDPSQLPEIPEDPPPRTRERNKAGTQVARYLYSRTPLGMATEFVNVVREGAGIANWVFEHARDRIIAYQEKPKFLDQLQRDAQDPKPGYDIHHIVEKTPAAKDGFSREQIEGWQNLVRIPTYRHWEINSWYETENPQYGNLTPRQYLRGKSWHERYAVGLKAMRINGVLK